MYRFESELCAFPSCRNTHVLRERDISRKLDPKNGRTNIQPQRMISLVHLCPAVPSVPTILLDRIAALHASVDPPTHNVVPEKALQTGQAVPPVLFPFVTVFRAVLQHFAHEVHVRKGIGFHVLEEWFDFDCISPEMTRQAFPYDPARQYTLQECPIYRQNVLSRQPPTQLISAHCSRPTVPRRPLRSKNHSSSLSSWDLVRC